MRTLSDPAPAAAQRLAIPAADVSLAAELVVPSGAQGVVVFAQPAGEAARSARAHALAAQLHEGRLATLCLDLLTADEEDVDALTTHLRFDVELLARRLLAVVDWAAAHPATRTLPLGLLGAGTGAAAALLVAARRPGQVRAVVARAGRPELTGSALDHARVPVLLVVGGDDAPGLECNERALAHLGPASRLEVVPGASHLFEEPGTLERVGELARDWFRRHLAPEPARQGAIGTAW